MQRNLSLALIDEADSILIDEARTPLVVSAVPDALATARRDAYGWAADHAGDFTSGHDFELDPQTQAVELTAAGRQRLRKTPAAGAVGELPLLDLYEFMEQAILVRHRFQADRHYVIRDGEVVIVDEFTGRLAEGRQWRAGLHQAIEAREGLEISHESGEAARITIQDLFLRYDRLTGMTGTVANSGRELKKIYATPAISIATNRPPKRRQLPDRVFGNSDAKLQAIAQEIRELSEAARPVLVGTRSIDKSQALSRLLNDAGLAHEVLNAHQIEREAEIIAQAGAAGRITVATNMAGRGTDIKLEPSALEAGGMHVICTELHESARIDRQLIGRCGRQGDPGSYRQYLSLDDDILMQAFGPSFVQRLSRYQKQESRLLGRFSKLFYQAQAMVESKHFKARQALLLAERRRHEVQLGLGQDPFLDTPG